MQEFVKGNAVVLMSDLREKLKEYPGLDKFYLGEFLLSNESGGKRLEILKFTAGSKCYIPTNPELRTLRTALVYWLQF